MCHQPAKYQLLNVIPFTPPLNISFIILFLFSVTVQTFQENLLKCMLQLEDTYFELGKSCDQNCLIICDRGAMDAAACNTTIIFMI